MVKLGLILMVVLLTLTFSAEAWIESPIMTPTLRFPDLCKGGEIGFLVIGHIYDGHSEGAVLSEIQHPDLQEHLICTLKNNQRVLVFHPATKSSVKGANP